MKRGFTKMPEANREVDDVGNAFAKNVRVAATSGASSKEPAKLLDIPLGDPRVRSKLRFDVVTAKVIETAGKKHVVSMKLGRGRKEVGSYIHFRIKSTWTTIALCSLRVNPV